MFRAGEPMFPITRTASRKGPVQQLEIRDQILLGASPVRQFLAARSAHLIPKELDQTFVDPVVVWLRDALAVFVAKPKQAFFSMAVQMSGLMFGSTSGAMDLPPSTTTT